MDSKNSRNGLAFRPPHFKNVVVTPDIIDRAVVKNSNHCMAAEAIKAANRHLSHISVDIQTIRASDPMRRQRYIWLTPRKVQTAIIAFDQGNEVQPFNFRLQHGQTIPIKETVKAAAVKAKRQAYDKKRKKRSKAVIKAKQPGGMPSIVGGKAPPKAAGATRTFGLRTLQY
jgi:hypothetical protein